MRSLASAALLLALGLAPLAQSARADASSEAAFRFLLAQSLTQEGAYREALELFEQVIELTPDDSYVRVEYAELLFRLGRLDEATEQAEAALSLGDENVEVLRLLAQIQLRVAEGDAGALDAARETFEELRRLAPSDMQAAVTLGQIYLSQERLEQAVELFDELLRQRPDDRMLVSFLGEALQRSNQDARAAEVLERFLAGDPGFQKLRLDLAEIQSRLGRHSAAVETLRGALDGEAGADADLRRRLAVELYRSGSSEEALASAGEVLAIRPDDFGARYLRALALVDLRRLEEAESQLMELVEESPENLDIALLYARVLEQRGAAEKAAAALERAVERLEQRERQVLARQARLQLAQLHARAGSWEQVIELSDELWEVGDRDSRVESLLLKAEALSRLDRGEEALAALASYGADGGRVPPRLIAREAEVLIGLGREEDADRRLEPLVESKDPEALLLVAEVYQRNELYGRAIPVLAEALAEEPQSLQVLFRLGASYEREGRHGEAEVKFQRLLTLDPEFAPALNYLGYMWADRGENLEEALDLVERAVAIEPDNGAYLDSLGWAYFRLGRYSDARLQLERAIELVPDDAIIYEHLGDLYEALGELDRAVEHYHRALSLGDDENEAEVRRKLERLAPVSP